MKKTFNLSHPTKNTDRHIEAIKGEIKKYLARERRKKLPDESHFWKFNCKFGNTQEDSKSIFANEIKNLIDQYVNDNKPSFYLEIISSLEKIKPKSE